MSGGSYNYLFCKEPCELFAYSNVCPFAVPHKKAAHMEKERASDGRSIL